MSRILIVDDEKDIRDALVEILEYEKYDTIQAEDGDQALQALKDTHVDAVLCDLRMPKMDGMELLEKCKEGEIDVPFIMISAHGTIDIAVEATKRGAYDFITKPPDLQKLLIAVRNATERTTLLGETKKLKSTLSTQNKIIGKSQAMIEMLDYVSKVAKTEARVLILGESGTGKELIANLLHEASPRAKNAKVAINCASIPSELIESELFGHEKGSFTSASASRIGKFEEASGGTLFLDEISDMSLIAQSKVLRALQENQITRVGGNKSISVNTRVLSATNSELTDMIDSKRFREDLYHRLSVVIIRVPPLRDRQEDIPLLIDHFLKEIAREHKSPVKAIEPEAVERLKRRRYTGNVRELRNFVERLIIFCDRVITPKDVDTYT